MCVCVCALWVGWDGGVACKGEKESAVLHLFVLVKCRRFRVMVVWGMGGQCRLDAVLNSRQRPVE